MAQDNNNKKLSLGSVAEIGSDVRIILMITNQCCLRCRYCAISKSRAVMRWEIIKKAINFLFSSKKNKLQLHFYGGEPLMVPFILLKKAIIYAKIKALYNKKSIEFLISTNGIFLSDEKINFFKKYKIGLDFSIDGDKATHNYNRPQKRAGAKSYDLVIKHLQQCLDNGVYIRASTVISPWRVNYLVNDFLHIVNHLGFKEIFLMTACGVPWSNRQINTLKKKLTELELLYSRLYCHGRKRIILSNINEHGAAFQIRTEVIMDIDGNVYPAGSIVSLGNEKIKRKFLLGHINDISNNSIDNVINDVYKELNNKYEQLLLQQDRSLISGVVANREIARFSQRLRAII